jgi:hypothetical protein
LLKKNSILSSSKNVCIHGFRSSGTSEKVDFETREALDRVKKSLKIWKRSSKDDYELPFGLNVYSNEIVILSNDYADFLRFKVNGYTFGQRERWPPIWIDIKKKRPLKKGAKKMNKRLKGVKKIL